jgi:CheY-like chemotaxis protein
VDGPLSDEQEKQVRFIRKAAEDLSSMVDDLLDLAKIEAGRVEVRPSEFTVEDLFSALRGMLRPLLISESVRLVFEPPQVGGPLFTDEGKLSQILRNFISNALKFTERGTVRVHAERVGEHLVRFVVSDTGIGIDPEDHERIFEEFIQIDNPLQKRIKGTGLGLPLCRRLATLLGGSIGVASEVGVGSSFWVLVPTHFPSPEAATAEARAAGPAAQPYNPTVLIIDDEEAARYVLRKLLSEYPLEVLEASDGPTGIDSARNALPEVIFLDIRMHGQDGRQVLAALKADPLTAAIPVVMVSSVTVDASDRAEYGAATAILHKDALTAQTLRMILERTSLVATQETPSPVVPAEARRR